MGKIEEDKKEAGESCNIFVLLQNVQYKCKKCHRIMYRALGKVQKTI